MVTILKDFAIPLVAAALLIVVGVWGRQPKPLKPRGRMSDAWKNQMLHNGWRDRGRR